MKNILTALGLAFVLRASAADQFVAGTRYNVSFETDSLTVDPSGWPTQFRNYVRPYDFVSVAQFIGRYTNSAVSGQYVTNEVNTYAAEVQPLKPSGGTNAWFFLLGGHNDIILGGYPAWVVINSLSNAWNQASSDGFKVYSLTLSTSVLYDASSALIRTDVNNYIISASNQWTKLYRLDARWGDPTDATIFTDGTHFTTAAKTIIGSEIGATLLPDIDSKPASFNNLNVGGTLTISR